MALFPETREYYDVYEYVPSVGWESPTWNYVGEVFYACRTCSVK